MFARVEAGSRNRATQLGKKGSMGSASPTLG